MQSPTLSHVTVNLWLCVTIQGKGQWLCFCPLQIYMYSRSNFSGAFGKNLALLLHAARWTTILGGLQQTKRLDCSEDGENLMVLIGPQNLSTVYDLLRVLILAGWIRKPMHVLSLYSGQSQDSRNGMGEGCCAWSSRWAEEGKEMGGIIISPPHSEALTLRLELKT